MNWSETVAYHKSVSIVSSMLLPRFSIQRAYELNKFHINKPNTMPVWWGIRLVWITCKIRIYFLLMLLWQQFANIAADNSIFGYHFTHWFDPITRKVFYSDVTTRDELSQPWDQNLDTKIIILISLRLPYAFRVSSLQWRHNEHDSVSNHQPCDCLLNRLFRRRLQKTSNLRVTGLCVGNSPGPVNSPHKGPVTRKMFPRHHDVIMSCEFPSEWFPRSSDKDNILLSA